MRSFRPESSWSSDIFSSLPESILLVRRQLSVLGSFSKHVPGRPTARWWVQFLDPVRMQGMQCLFLGILWQRSAKGLELVEGVKMRKDRLLQDTITQTFKNHLVTILYRSTILICSYHSLSSYPSTLDVWIQGVYRSFTQSCIDEVTTWMYWRSELLSSMGCPGACDWGWAPWIVFMYVSTENEESDNSLVHTPPL